MDCIASELGQPTIGDFKKAYNTLHRISKYISAGLLQRQDFMGGGAKFHRGEKIFIARGENFSMKIFPGGIFFRGENFYVTPATRMESLITIPRIFDNNALHKLTI